MRIAILSGKGGTGKTLLSVNMAAILRDALYIDCDVEEPNGHLFFNPEGIIEEEVTQMVPIIERERCNGCRKCVDFCKFNALAYIGDGVMAFHDICHSCGGCSLVCPQGAISERAKNIGRIERGISHGVHVVTGILNTGEPSGVPIINALLSGNWGPREFTFIDCPPGSACVVMESIKDADYCILVAEPTIFGVHNLDMVYELMKLFNKPYGVVINKYLSMENPAQEFCTKRNIKVLGRIPYDEELARLNSSGIIATRESDRYKEIFSSILGRVLEEAGHETAINP